MDPNVKIFYSPITDRFWFKINPNKAAKELENYTNEFIFGPFLIPYILVVAVGKVENIPPKVIEDMHTNNG